MIIFHSYTRRGNGAKRALGYLMHRPSGPCLEPDHRVPFTVRNGQIQELTRSDAMELLGKHQGNSPFFHKLVISPAGFEDTRDLKCLTDMVMTRLSEKKGIALDWVAVEHFNTDNPHSHVLASGYGTNLVTGAIQELRLDQNDYADMRDWGREWCIDLREFHHKRLPEEKDPQNLMVSRDEAIAYRGLER